MKKMVLIFCIAAFASGIAVGTDKPMYISRTATIHLSVNDVSASDEIIIDLIAEYGLVIENLNKDGFDRVNDYVLLSSQEQFPDVVNKIELLGITTLNKIETINNVNELKGIDFDLEYFAVQKEQYQNELRKMNTSQNDKYYQKLWEADRDFDQSIYEKRKIRLILLDEVEFHRIILKISEKEPQDLDVSDGFFELINMPGIESHFFHIENPVDTVSAGTYLGGSLRYMFTKGKSFFTVGVLRPVLNSDQSITTQINDIVLYGLGKDFYPRYLGQGRRRFFNLYSGFLVGGMVMTSEDHIYHMFTAEPHLGLEIFKNQYVIIDTRVGYLLPLDKDRIKILRGINHSFTLNIVF